MSGLMGVVNATPCAPVADQFTAGQFTAGQFTEDKVNHLAATYCDGCPIRGECYRSALRDDSAWGVYGGVLFANGQPVQARRAALRRPSRKSIPMLRAS